MKEHHKIKERQLYAIVDGRMSYVDKWTNEGMSLTSASGTIIWLGSLVVYQKIQDGTLEFFQVTMIPDMDETKPSDWKTWLPPYV